MVRYHLLCMYKSTPESQLNKVGHYHVAKKCIKLSIVPIISGVATCYFITQLSLVFYERSISILGHNMKSLLIDFYQSMQVFLWCSSHNLDDNLKLNCFTYFVCLMLSANAAELTMLIWAYSICRSLVCVQSKRTALWLSFAVAVLVPLSTGARRF